MSSATIPGQWTLMDGAVVRYEDVVILELVQVAKAGHQIILGYAQPQARAQDMLAGVHEAGMEREAMHTWAASGVSETQVPTATLPCGQDFGLFPSLFPSPLAPFRLSFGLGLDQDDAGEASRIGDQHINQELDNIENVRGRGHRVIPETDVLNVESWSSISGILPSFQLTLSTNYEQRLAP